MSKVNEGQLQAMKALAEVNPISHKDKMAAIKERNYQHVVELIRLNKTAHCSTLMVTEARMNELKRNYVFAAVPSSCSGKCFMFCKG